METIAEIEPQDENQNTGSTKDYNHPDGGKVAARVLRGAKPPTPIKNNSSEVDEYDISFCSEASDPVSLNSSTEQLLLVTEHPQVFRELPASEMACVQKKLFKLGTCQMVCWKCDEIIPYVRLDQEPIVRHLNDCWSTAESLSLHTEELRSVFSEIKAYAEAMLASDYVESDETVDEEEEEENILKLVQEDMNATKKERLMFLCEPEDNVWERRMGLVLAFSPEDTFNDLHEEIQNIWFGCCGLPTVLKDAANKEEVLPQEVSQKLKVLAKSGLSFRYRYGTGSCFTMVRITSLGCLESLDPMSNHDDGCTRERAMMSNAPVDLVCSGCYREPGIYILSVQENFLPRHLLLSAESLFHPRTFCSLQCLDTFNNLPANKHLKYSRSFLQRLENSPRNMTCCYNYSLNYSDAIDTSASTQSSSSTQESECTCTHCHASCSCTDCTSSRTCSTARSCSTSSCTRSSRCTSSSTDTSRKDSSTA